MSYTDNQQQNEPESSQVETTGVTPSTHTGSRTLALRIIGERVTDEALIEEVSKIKPGHGADRILMESMKPGEVRFIKGELPVARMRVSGVNHAHLHIDGAHWSLIPGTKNTSRENLVRRDENRSTKNGE